MEEKILKLTKLIEEYKNTYRVKIAFWQYNNGWVKEWVVEDNVTGGEWCGKTIEEALDKAIDEVEEFIREEEEEEREYLEERERAYWEVQGVRY